MLKYQEAIDFLKSKDEFMCIGVDSTCGYPCSIQFNGQKLYLKNFSYFINKNTLRLRVGVDYRRYYCTMYSILINLDTKEMTEDKTEIDRGMVSVESTFDENPREFEIRYLRSVSQYKSVREETHLENVDDIIDLCFKFLSEEDSSYFELRTYKINLNTTLKKDICQYKEERVYIDRVISSNFAKCKVTNMNVLQSISPSLFSKKYANEFKILKNTFFDLKSLLREYIKPGMGAAIEKIVKSGYFTFEHEINYGQYVDSLKIDPSKNSVFDILKVPKENFKAFKELWSYILEHRIGHSLNIMQMATQEAFIDKAKIIMLLARNSTWISEHDVTSLSTLVVDHGYNCDRLLDYLTRDIPYNQGITELQEGLRILRDYIGMCSEMNIKYEKYPKSLKLYHDLAVIKYNAVKKEIDRTKFCSKYEGMPYTVKGKEVSLVKPESPKDLVDEGSNLNHCVASYISRVINGDCIILFIRKNDELDKSLYTIQVVNSEIVQAKGIGNTEVPGEYLEEAKNLLKKMIAPKLKNVV